MKKNIACLIVMGSSLFMVADAGATDRTWDGGGADGNWTTPANWDGDAAAPASGDALIFGGSAQLTNTNDLEAGTSFSGLTFANGAGAFSLWGNAITLGGDVLNNDSDAQTLHVPLTLDATRTFTAASGDLACNGVISGSGGITKEGGKPLYLSGDNTYDGVTAVNTGTVVITHANALGSTAGNTTINNGHLATLELQGNLMNIAEPLSVTGGSVSRNSLLNGSGTNTLSGLITTTGGRYNANGGTWLKITGGVTGSNPFFVVNANGTIEFTTTPISIGTGTFHADSGGLTILGVSGNVWGGTLFTGGTLRMDVTNALPATTDLKIGGVSYGPNATMNLNGFDQTIASITRAGPAAGTVIITSDTPATLTINQNASTTYEGRFAGSVSVVKNGTGLLSLSNALSTTVGSFIVSNGTLRVTPASSLGNSTNIVVAGGLLDLQNDMAISDAATVSLSDGGILTLQAGLSERVDHLFLGGTQQPSGSYGSSASGADFTNDVYFAGPGQLVVWSSPPIAAVDAVWDADGGSADTLFGTATNWEDDALPAFDGTTLATFATAGSTATVDQAVSLYGMRFNRDANFTLAEGGGVITNGAGGLFAQVPASSARTYTLAENLVLGDNQTWCVTNNGSAGTTVAVTGSIDDGPIARTLTKIGNGTLTLSGDSTFDSDVVISSGWVRVTHANALGRTNGTTRSEGVAGGFLYLGSNVSLQEPLILNGERNNAGSLRSDSGNCVLGGPLTCYNQVRLQVYGGTLSVTGGVYQADGSSSGLFVINSGATITFSGNPLDLGSKTFYTDSGGLTVLAVSGNNWADTLVANGRLRLDVPDAIPTTATLRMGIGYGPKGTFDLNGNDQTLARLYLGTTAAGARVITSETPATLTVNQNANDTIDMAFTGAVSLVKSGTGTLTLTNAFTSTTGGFTVTNGTLAIARDGTLGPNSTNIVVSGNGTLALSNSVVIADSAVVQMPAAEVDTAKITLADGVNDIVGWLYYGNKMQRVGTYGSSSSPAAHKDDTHFAGSGMLTVMHDNSGTMISLR